MDDELRMYIDHYKIEDQREGESDAALRRRVSRALIDQGLIIEGHEVAVGPGARWSDTPAVMDGLTGHIARAMGMAPAGLGDDPAMDQALGSILRERQGPQR